MSRRFKAFLYGTEDALPMDYLVAIAAAVGCMIVLLVDGLV